MTLRGRLLYAVNKGLRKWVERRVLKAARRVVVLSEFTRNKLTGIYGFPEEKVTIIPRWRGHSTFSAPGE